MTIKASGSLSLQEINAEFGLGTNLNAYRGVKYWNTDGTSGNFSSGAISFSDFYSKSATFPGARYWRWLANDTPTFYWDIRTSAAGQAGVFETSDLSGTNIASPLSYSATLSFRKSNDTISTNGAGFQGNPFAGAALLVSEVNFSAGGYLFMDFSQQRTIRSVFWRNPAGFDRDINNMSLQWSNNNSNWTTWATLTNTTTLPTPFWRNITEGSTIAATSS